MRRTRSADIEESSSSTDQTGAMSNGASSKNSDLSPVLEHHSARRRPTSADMIDATVTSAAPAQSVTSSSQGTTSTQPRTVRNVKLRDLRNKLKRAKSGSSVDYQHLQTQLLLSRGMTSAGVTSQQPQQQQQQQQKTYEIYDDTILYTQNNNNSKKHYSN